MKTKEVNLKGFLEKEIASQWKSVVKEYPLIAASILMTKKEYASVMIEKLPEAKEFKDIFDDKLTTDVAIQIRFRLSKCFRNLEVNLGRASSDGEVKDAFDGFGDCLRHK
ncbi:MAG: hypothetical protein A2X13_15060 [Bacteroidetes bacterium GWC2_33_15]|nr:MAG: hypothetical protein A2X10_07125 [Bacteroidetes bacterium GWA2_33_15]OFX50189.1 MAG: hypothetical protein A2X13_15060 [Bacteroidetes bacterium GWC2_33_15]OFX65341.1 MAG: hypothetical protein A2X15_04635 [Bacteroidetes bacterium GWB2_32_14]OFX70568.1 MAG: hypothetical protein A2X14_04690 [Bacteroidetes bacterium GWD2_33_33]HAN19558.1 hypothetical protein [Bacteroidales bacterium]